MAGRPIDAQFLKSSVAMNMQQSRPPEAVPVMRRAAERPFEPLDYGLYALTVIAWSLSWYAIEFQVGTVANEVNIVWRFAIATALMFGWVVLKRGRLRFAWVDHMRFMALGILMFSSNFLLFYYGAGYLVSGLLSVVFSLASVMNMMLGAIVMREKPSPRILLGGFTGFCGIALMFLPEIVGHDLGGGTLLGLAFCVAGTLSFCIGNVISAAGMRKGLPLVSMNAWGMFYGTLCRRSWPFRWAAPSPWCRRWPISVRCCSWRWSPPSWALPPTSRCSAASARRAPAMPR
ncbi:DMT family transporter [Mesorhizobium amorphae]|uniref:DMT family transporter n=1 Tax=Mesorhizobium amorphae TaxID=71433 RepID=UPI0028CB5A70|nr:DMT family transporter [Mesorhizobium amorphae]